jgi:glycosyltransferase involved in cell wall biosynthesis
MQNPLINILLRTHNRPIGFKRMLDSIRSQTYQNYRLIISVDNPETEKYVQGYGISDYIKPVRDETRPFPADCYFNDMIPKAQEGFIWYVDDDDFIPHNGVLELIRSTLKDGMINIYKMKSPTCIIPNYEITGKAIVECCIGTPCFIIPVEIAGLVKWAGQSGSDYLYIKELSEKVGTDKINWIDEIIYHIDKPSQRGKGEF